MICYLLSLLGKGTSARDGSALAGALLEHLDARQVSGVFATHLHELFQLPLHLQVSSSMLLHHFLTRTSLSLLQYHHTAYHRETDGVQHLSR